MAQIYHLFFFVLNFVFIASSSHTPRSRPYVDISVCFHQLILKPHSKASLRLVPINACHMMTTQARNGGRKKDTTSHASASAQRRSWQFRQNPHEPFLWTIHQRFYCMQINSISWSYSVYQPHLHGFQSVIPMLLHTQTFIVTHFSPLPLHFGIIYQRINVWTITSLTVGTSYIRTSWHMHLGTSWLRTSCAAW